MTWLDTVVNDRGVLAVFGRAPSLASIDVRDLFFDPYGPQIRLTFALHDYPADPPGKWAAQGFTTAVLALSFIALSEVRLTGWTGGVVGDLGLERIDGGVAVAFTAPRTTLTCTTEFVDVQKISACRDRPDDVGW
jgi:Immunity protein 50